MTSPVFRDTSLDIELRIEALLGVLTLDEKLSLCAGQNFWQTRAVPRLDIKPFRVSDGPRGVAWHSSGFGRHTAFPSGIALGASWDEGLALEFGEALGAEAKAAGRQMILGPAVNICRTPVNGRTFEYLTEDPWLNQRLAVAMVQGIQSRGVAACIKHYAANSQETQRMKNSSEVSERALREIYLPAFEAAVVEADVWSVMAAYNAVNGTAACEHPDLLQAKLRGEWGFRGFVVSDWFAVRRTSSPEACLKAGLNLEMPGKGSRYKHKQLRQAFDAGRFSESELDASLAPLLRVMFLTGRIDDLPRKKLSVAQRQGHRDLARRMAAEGMVLLKNEGATLPLEAGRVRKLAVMGPKAKKRNCLPLWGGSSGVWPPEEITPLQGIASGLPAGMALVDKPEQADAVVLLLGLSHRPGLDSEVMDRKHLGLPAKQEKLLRRTLEKNPNTVVVLINGGPLLMDWAQQVPAILEAWYPGMEGGNAIADVLFGKVNPSGKLPVTFPARLEHSPAHGHPRNYPGEDLKVHYEEGVFVGYRHFDQLALEPLFPFGHGLSYTRFEYPELAVDKQRIRAGEVLTVQVRVENTGERAGAEVVQLYLGDEEASVPRPPRELVAFEKILLQAGEASTLTFSLGQRAMAYFCEATDTWRVEPGRFTLAVGSSSRDIRRQVTFDVLE